MTDEITPAVDSRLRRLARKKGYSLHRSRWRRDSIDNLGGYMIVDPMLNLCVAGERYDLAPSYVEDWLTDGG
jgi:hypothetical protein